MIRGDTGMTGTLMTLLFGLCLLGSVGCQKAPPDQQKRTVSGILKHYPSDVRTPEAWMGHNFLVNGVPVQPSGNVPEAMLRTYVGKRVAASGKWNPGAVWKPTEEEKRAQLPVNLDPAAPIIRGDGIVVDAIVVLQDN